MVNFEPQDLLFTKWISLTFEHCFEQFSQHLVAMLADESRSLVSCAGICIMLSKVQNAGVGFKRGEDIYSEIQRGGI